MSGFTVAPRARLDLDQIWLHIASDNPTAADRLLKQFKDRFALLATQPLMGQTADYLPLGVRSFSFGSYIIFYRPVAREIEISRVIHGARDVNSIF